MKLSPFTLALAVLASLTLPGIAEKASFYKNPEALFSKRPSEEVSVQNLTRFGPVGLSIDLVQPAFTMKVAGVEEGSPAAETGKFKKGQTIESVNGEALKDIDPRMQMARWIEQSEAADGKMTFVIQGEADPVVVQLPVLGAYSESWPMDCQKSDKIVRNLADWIAEDPSRYGLGDLGMFFLISTGNEKDTKVVGEWARQASNPSQFAWFLGFGGIPLCEYYLRTGDKEVLPNIQKWVDSAVSGQYNDAWAGRGGVPGLTYGNGHLNAAGTSVVTFLLLAKECGVDVPDHALMGSLRHFYRYAGRGGNPYGDDRPEMGFVDNGKNGNLAFTMAAAASLTPKGEQSVYAKARDLCAMKSFYSTSFMLHGHTGGGIGEIWRSASMSLLKEKRPAQYRDFMDNRRWHYELSRRFDGSFGILGGGAYDVEKWGVAYGLCYTVPRQTLRITGAPPSKYSVPYTLPEVPWGTVADNEFVSVDPVPMADGTMMDMSKETLAGDASLGFLRKFHGPKEISDDLIRHYIHHPDPVIRRIAAAKALGVNHGYIGWLAPGGKVRPELVIEFLKHPSPRVRRPMFAALENVIHRNKKIELLTPEVFALAVKSVKDPSESWWVKDAALQVIGYGTADQILPHVDDLLGFLKIDDWWLQNAAMQALTPVAADPRCFRKVLPPIGELIRHNQRAALTLGLMPGIRQKIREAGPEVQEFAVKVLMESYTDYAGVDTAPGGLDISKTVDGHLERIAGSLAELPGGLDVLYTISRERKPNQILPYKEFFLQADPKQFGPKLKQAITPIIMDELIPEYVGRNRKKLREEETLEKQSIQPGGNNDAIDGLVALYDRAGHDDYNWRMFFDLNEADFAYHSFDPIAEDQVPWDHLVNRYREVTMPVGMEKWFDPSFDPTKAGWKTGKAPFGNYDGQLPRGIHSKCSERCVGPNCYGAVPCNTLWEKEVLLLRGTFKVPALKDGHRYRLRVNHRAHVGNGGGFGIYVNGRLMAEMTKCLGRGQGEQANGGFITADFLKDFQGEKVTIGVKSFIRYNDKYNTKPSQKVPQGRISLQIDEQKLPPMGDDLITKSASVVPMTCLAWQKIVQNPEENADVNPDEFLFCWDGKWQDHPALKGKWKAVATLNPSEEFDPKKNYNPHYAFTQSVEFKPEGKTADPLLLWSGDMLMDLKYYQALKVTPREIDGVPYLFVENGDFNNRKKPDWEPGVVVFGRP